MTARKDACRSPKREHNRVQTQLTPGSVFTSIMQFKAAFLRSSLDSQLDPFSSYLHWHSSPAPWLAFHFEMEWWVKSCHSFCSGLSLPPRMWSVIINLLRWLCTQQSGLGTGYQFQVCMESDPFRAILTACKVSRWPRSITHKLMEDYSFENIKQDQWEK